MLQDALFVLIISCLTTLGFTKDEFCDIDCFVGIRKIRHLRCDFSVQYTIGECYDIDSEITTTERMDILHLHNKLRNDLNSEDFDNTTSKWAPGNMRQLVWDCEMEKSARIWATQCQGKEPYGCIKTKEMNLWMNVALFSTTKSPMVDGFNHFGGPMVDGFNHFGGPMERMKPLEQQVDSFESSRQPKLQSSFAMIWAETFKLGCSRANYKHGKNRSLLSTVVCIYGPTGNIQYQPIMIRDFKGGCNHCPPDTHCKPRSVYPKLCAKQDDPVKVEPIPHCKGTIHRLPLLWFFIAIPLASILD